MLCDRWPDRGLRVAGRKAAGGPGNYLGHFSAYSLAMVALAGAARLGLVTALALVFLGVGIEFLQPLFDRETTGRHAANSVGVGIGWLTMVVKDASTRLIRYISASPCREKIAQICLSGWRVFDAER